MTLQVVQQIKMLVWKKTYINAPCFFGETEPSTMHTLDVDIGLINPVLVNPSRRHRRSVL